MGQQPDLTVTASAEDVVNALIEELSASGGVNAAKLKLYRIPDGGSTRDKRYVALLPFSEDFQELVREAHGGGEYYGVVTVNGRYKTAFPFSIDGAPKSAGDASAPSAPQVPDYVSHIEKVLAPVVERLTTPPAPAPQPDQLAQLERMSAIIGNISKGNDGIDTLRVIEMIRDAEERGERRARRFAENGDGGDSVAAVAAKGLEFLGNLAARDTNGAHAPTPPAAMPAQSGDSAAPTAPPMVDPLADPASYPDGYGWLAALVEYWPRLAQAAYLQLSPAKTALRVLDAVEDNSPALFDTLEEAVHRDDFATVLLHSVEPMRKYERWFGEFIAAVQEEFNVGGDAETASPVVRQDAASTSPTSSRPRTSGGRAKGTVRGGRR